MEDKKQEYLNFYERLLNYQTSFILDMYTKMFENLSEEENANIYKTFYLKTKIKSEFVYFIYNKYTKLVKIGMSNNPIQRLKSLNSTFKTQFGLNDALELLGVKFIPSGKKEQVEKLYHNKFSKYRRNGEWFEIDRNYILQEILIGSLYCNFKIDFDTDDFYENEGFRKQIKFLTPSKSELFIFALDTMDEQTLKISGNNIDTATFIKKIIADNLCEKYGYRYLNFYGIDIRDFKEPFSASSDNLTWEIFKWLYKNYNKYVLSTQEKVDPDTGSLKRKVIGFGNNSEVLTPTKLVEDYVMQYFS